MEYIKLSDISTIIMGQSPNSDTYNEIGEGVPFFQGKADFGRVNPKVRMYCSKPTKLAEVSDILMSVRAPVGDVNIANEQCCIGRGLCAIRGSIDINNKFLYYYLITMKEELNSKATGSTFKAINKSILEEVTIPNISIDKQNNIVKVLDKAQELIDKRREQIEDLDKLIKSQFIEMFGDPFLNPKGWNVSNYEDICTCITDGEHSTPKRCEEGIYLLSARNVLNHSLQLDDVDFIGEDEYTRISKRIIPEENDILISCSGSVGRVCKVPANIKFQMVRSVAILKLKDNINSTFMEWLIDSNYTQQQILKSINQSSQANLFQGKIKKLKAIVPPIELQSQFADFVNQVDKLKFEMVKSLKELEDNFSSLMQKAFKGELF